MRLRQPEGVNPVRVTPLQIYRKRLNGVGAAFADGVVAGAFNV
jgi:hypothetical protein